MKQLALFVYVVILVLKFTNTDAHFKSFHADTLLSPLPLEYQQKSTIGQFDNLKTSLAVTKTVAFMNLLSSSPKLLCLVPPIFITDFLTQLSCNAALLNAIPRHVITGFMTSLSANPTLVRSIPETVFVSISKTLSIGAPGATGAVLPGGSPSTAVVGSSAASSSSKSPVLTVGAEVAAAVIPGGPSPPPAVSQLPAVQVSDKIAATVIPGGPSPPVPQSPAVQVNDKFTAVVAPIAQPPSGAPNSPVVNAEAAGAITSYGPSSSPANDLPGVSVAKEVGVNIAPAEVTPSPSIPVLPADLPTTNSVPPPNAYPPVSGPSALPEPCDEIQTPPIALPSPLPVPSLSLLQTVFNKEAGNNILESKIESILKLLGNLKLPQLHAPAVPPIPIVHKPKIFVLLPAPLIGKPIEVKPTQLEKLYYQPGSLDQILGIVRKRLPTPQTLSLPKLPKLPALTSNPIRCLPLISKVPC